MGYNKPSKKMIAKYRSWKIMEEYFGVKQPGMSSTWVGINWRKILPKEQIAALDNLIKQAREKWEEMAKLN